MQAKTQGSRLAWVLGGLLLVAGQGLCAAEEEKQKDEAPRQEKTAEESKGRREQPAKVPPVFIPTEEISADNAVSFPTDI